MDCRCLDLDAVDPVWSWTNQALPDVSTVPLLKELKTYGVGIAVHGKSDAAPF